MKLLELDKKKGVIHLTVENMDDLWHLYNLIQKDDVVYAKTTREIKVGSETGRPTKGKRILLKLGIKVTDIFFDKSLNRLRIRGIVVEAPERYDGLMGSYHTLSIQQTNTLKIVKQEILGYHLKRLEDACKVEEPPIIVVSLDDEEACVAVVQRFGVNLKFEKKLRLPGKLETEKREDATKKYFSEILKALQETLKSTDGTIIVVGPGFLKNDFVNYLKEKLPQPQPEIYVGSTSVAGLAGVFEAVRSGIILNIAKQHRFLEEAQIVEKFFAEVAKERGKATYGLEEVKNAALMGAVKVLMVVDKYLRGCLDEERIKLEEIIRLVEKKGGKVMVLSGENEAGEKILSLGGIAAILRFPTR